MEKLRTDTIRDVRCCLQIVKGLIDITRLAADFKTYTSHPIRHQQLGYDSLEAFLRSIDSIVVRKHNGQILIEAKRNPLSAHIVDMVARQKQPRKLKRIANLKSTNFEDKSKPNANSNAKEPTKWRPVENKTEKTKHKTQNRVYYQDSPRIAQHNQFVVNEKKFKRSASFNNNNNFVNNFNINKGEKFERQMSSDFVESGNVSKDLWNFTRFCRIAEPEITVLERKCKPNRPAQFDCKIKVDGESLSSFPDDCYDERSATLSASKKALDKLIKKYGRTRPQSFPTSTEAAIVERIPPLVGKHFNGVWSWQIEADYKDAYQEALPASWLTLFEDNSVISVENFGEKFVLRVATTSNVQKDKTSSAILASDISIPTSSASFDEKGYMRAKITCPVSAGEIWCRALDSHEAVSFDDLSKKINEFYNLQYETNKLRPQNATEIKIGSYYMVWLEKSGWHRAKLLEVQTTAAICMLIDVGEDQSIPFEHIYALQSQFARNRAQAFVCRLAGLENLYEVSHVSQSDAIVELHGLEVTLENVSEDAEDILKIFRVVMYDIETGAALNRDLMIAIAVENCTHCFEADQTFDAFVSHISGNSGLIYVQIHSAGYNVFMDLLNEFSFTSQSDKFKITRDNSKDKLFLVKLHSCYERVKIVDSPENFQYAQILCVDTGRKEIIKMSDTLLIPVDANSPLGKFPAQATLVRLQLKRMPDDLPAKITELIPKGQQVLLRVQDTSKHKDNIPNVMLFLPQNNGLLSINDSLSLPSLESLKSPETLEKTNVPSTGILQSPRLPALKEYFEVKIPFAVNPWNFFVSPLDTTRELRDMQSKMQATFANRHLEPVNLKEIKAGNIYAAKRDVDGNTAEGEWCRVCVLKTIYPSAIVAFYVDFGYYANLSYQNLFALDRQFVELPHQAIKAKLAGVKPIQEKWSVDNCRYFEKLVQLREYVSVICKIEKDELYPCDNVLVLKLIDTKTSEKDVVIGDLLIQKKIAVRDV